MAKFKFKNNSLELEIENEKFFVTIDDFRDANKYLEIAEKAQSLKDTDSVEEVLKLMRELIDGILGEGATDKIFKNREFNITDSIDLIVFLNEEINKFKNEKLRIVYSPYRKDELNNWWSTYSS